MLLLPKVVKYEGPFEIIAIYSCCCWYGSAAARESMIFYAHFFFPQKHQLKFFKKDSGNRYAVQGKKKVVKTRARLVHTQQIKKNSPPKKPKYKELDTGMGPIDSPKRVIEVQNWSDRLHMGRHLIELNIAPRYDFRHIKISEISLYPCVPQCNLDRGKWRT